MKYNRDIHQRRSIRLKGYDYTNAGAYFVTICTQHRECVLDDPVVKGIIADVWYVLPQWFPTIALDEFVVMPNHVHLIMWLQSHHGDNAVALVPTAGNDVGATLAVAHDVVARDDRADVRATLAVARDAVARDDRAGARPAPTEPDKVNLRPTLGDVIGGFKSLVFTTYLDWIEKHEPQRRAKFWQRNYYEHIVRNEHELHAIRQYIQDNPAHWELDRDNLKNIRHLPPPTKVEDYLVAIGINP